MNSPAGYCGVLLAAGRSRRFGADKLMNRLDNGTPVALASLRALQQVLPNTIAVVRPDNHELIDALKQSDVAVVIANDADAGMGRSLAAGIAATAQARGWVVALADMPYMQTASIARVLAALQRGATLAAPIHDGQRGHPVGFDARFRDELLALNNDEGARSLLRAHADALTLIECADAGILRDIDFPQDLRAAENSSGA